MRRPAPPPEAVLLRRMRMAAGISVPTASAQAGVSTGRWNQVEYGYESRKGAYKPVRARPETLAHMAHAVRVTPGRLEEAAREHTDTQDRERVLAATDILREIIQLQSQDGDASATVPATPSRPGARPPDPDGTRRVHYADPDLEQTARELEHLFPALHHSDVMELVEEYKRERERLLRQATERAEVRHLRAVRDSG